MSSTLPPNLTGKVRKTGKYYFANGGLADVWEGELGGQPVAVKIIRSVFSREHLSYLETKFLKEAEVWNQLNHPNITPFLGISFDLGVPGAPCLVCPYYSNGNITQYLQRASIDLTDLRRQTLVTQVAAGLAYLHERGVIHGDMKASNVLVDEMGEARIADFGLSRILEVTGFTTKSVGGTCRWMAQELIAPGDDEEESTPRVTTESDVWAFGMTVLEILTSQLPFVTIKLDSAVLLAIMRGGRPSRDAYSKIPDDIWAVLQRCWDVDPYKRPTMRDLVSEFNSRCTAPLPLSTRAPCDPGPSAPSRGNTTNRRRDEGNSSSNQTWEAHFAAYFWWI